MALRRLVLRLLAETAAAAAARGRAPSADPSAPRRFSRLLRLDAMAAAGARCQEVRACAAARVRAVRAGGEAARTAARASAEARARDAYAFLLRAQRQAAAATTGPRLRQASDRTLATFMRILYGESAPIVKTPSPIEMLHALEILRYRLTILSHYLNTADRILEMFMRLNEQDQSILIAILAAPVLAVAVVFTYMIPSSRVSTAPPEFLCPFIGISGVTLEECSEDECLEAVLSLLATCGGVAIMFFGGLVISLSIDVVDLLDINGLLDLVFNIKNDCTPQDEENLRNSCYILADVISGNTPEAAKYLDIKGLLDLTSPTVADIKGLLDLTSPTVADIKGLLDLTSPTVADIKGLLDLTSPTVADIKGKTPEEICRTFNINNHLTYKKLLYLTSVADILKGMTTEDEEDQWVFE